MNKKGFTLIELLAVIVILAVIALIATPVILGIIEKSRKGAFEQSINGIIRSAEVYRAKVEITDPIADCRYFSFEEGKDVSAPTQVLDKLYYPLSDLGLKGDLPTEGEVMICSDRISIEASNGDYTAVYDGNDTIISNGDLGNVEITSANFEYEFTPDVEGAEYYNKEVIKVLYTGTEIENPYFYVKSTRATVSNIVVNASCGTGNDPATCTTIDNTMALSADTWYRFTSAPTLTYSVPATEVGTLYVAIGDGRNISQQATTEIVKIYYQAEDISYTNAAVPDISNVSQALDYLYDNLK